MHKKGSEMAINPLIVIALGVLVLVILIVIFRDQVKKGSDQYTGIYQQANLDDTKCSFLMGRSCFNGRACPSEKPNKVSQAKDCKNNQVCCQAQ